MNPRLPDTEEFRDHISTVDATGNRIWVYPKKPQGRFYRARTYISYILLLLMFGLPFVKYKGEPLFLFNILERKFILFGVVFTPQDLHLFALAMMTLMLFIVLFTVIFGRLFCGWICPQTIFMEMVFRKVEYLIEGDAHKQRRLDKMSMNGEKLLKRSLKHIVFFTISVIVANTFLSWIIGVDQVIKIASEPISQNMGGFATMLIFSGVFYFIFSYFREQVCTAVCPYGRLQGVLLMKDSIVIAYDWIRGEPRGKLLRKKSSVPLIQEQGTAQSDGLAIEGATPATAQTGETARTTGDCIDCKLCIQVCPTGIDIRNGTQLECINCTACIDACDEIMDKIERPRGLIRYDSYSGIEEGRKRIFTARVMAYSSVLGILILLQVFLFAFRTEVETIVLRTPGMLYQKVDDTFISNLYNYQVINKTTKEIENIEFKLRGEHADHGKIKIVGNVSPAGKQAISEGAFFIELDKTKLNDRKTRLIIDVYSNGEKIDESKTNFLGPVK